MLIHQTVGVILLTMGLSQAAGGEDKALTPIQVRKRIGEKISVEMTVRAAKDRLTKRGEIYLDAEMDFRERSIEQARRDLPRRRSGFQA